MASVQMNVRMEDALKGEGDAVFAEIGYTPTDVVREVWGFARRNRHRPRVVADVMRQMRDPKEAQKEGLAHLDIPI